MRARATRPRDEIEILRGILRNLEEGRMGTWEIVTLNNMNAAMCKKYRARMLKLGLISKVELAPGRAGFEITPRGRELLGVIRAYRSIWPP